MLFGNAFMTSTKGAQAFTKRKMNVQAYAFSGFTFFEALEE